MELMELMAAYTKSSSLVIFMICCYKNGLVKCVTRIWSDEVLANVWTFIRWYKLKNSEIEQKEGIFKIKNDKVNMNNL